MKDLQAPRNSRHPARMKSGKAQSRSAAHDAIFTWSERTQKNYTIGAAVEAAKQVLEAKFSSIDLCIDSIVNRALTERITLLELNVVQSRLLSDSYAAR